MEGSAESRSFRNLEDARSSVPGSCYRAARRPFIPGRQWWRPPRGRLLVIAEQLKDNERLEESSLGLYCHLVVTIAYSTTKLWEPFEGQIAVAWKALKG